MTRVEDRTWLSAGSLQRVALIWAKAESALAVGARIIATPNASGIGRAAPRGSGYPESYATNRTGVRSTATCVKASSRPAPKLASNAHNTLDAGVASGGDAPVSRGCVVH